MKSLTSDNTNISCPLSLLWTQPVIDSRRSLFYVCIIASITHSLFWLQLVFCSSLRQKSMQWIYAYLITDILLLFRFFFISIVHSTSNECIPNSSWSLFFCYFEATVDNYLNILEVYILLALNVCRYAQIAYNRNVYTTDIRLLILAHLVIYLLPLISLIVQFIIGWAQLDQFIQDSCDVHFSNVYVQIFNIIIGFALPIILNVIVIYASMHHVHLTSKLRKGQNHVSAREKYNRSLVMQFLVFYIVWVSLWSPNVIVYQLTSGRNDITTIAMLLNFIEIALDPIIIAALDVRFWHVWRKAWLRLKNNYLKGFQIQRRRIRPINTNPDIQAAPPQRTTAM